MQLVCNLVDYGMDPQAAIDAPRFHIKEDEGKPVNNPILFEESRITVLANGTHPRNIVVTSENDMYFIMCSFPLKAVLVDAD